MERLQGKISVNKNVRQQAIALCAVCLALNSFTCINPFAPGLDDQPGRGICSDLTTIAGIFCTFQNSYSFRDTTLYGSLMAPDFIFIYRDYDNGVDVTWGRDQEMRSSYGLFQNVQTLLLTWNNEITREGASENDSTVVRSFNLTVAFNPSNIERVDGYANLQFRRASNSDPWKIVRWRDESNF